MQNRSIQGIIFDLDGVLIHTDEYHYLAWKAIADRLGVPFDRSVNDRMRGVSRMESLRILLERKPGTPLPAVEEEALCERKNAIYREYLARLTPEDVSAGVRDVLHTLRASGFRLAVGSSSRNAGFILRRVGLTDAFDATADGSMITRSKPDPEVFLRAAEQLGLPPAACAVVEDAPAGIRAARAAGMLAIGLGDGFRAGEDEPDERIASLGELPELLRSGRCRPLSGERTS